MIKPIYHSILEILHLISENALIIKKYTILAMLPFALISGLGHYQLALRCLQWIILGIASSIGLGFGMHTFVLFLGPHIAAVTMAAHDCKSLDFPQPPYPSEIICPNYISNQQITFFNILTKVSLDAFMWGIGTAIGELPPYLAARLRAQATRRNFGGDDPNAANQVAGWELVMIKVINKVGFFGILLCAAIPNPLFDAAGIASGIAQVPFMTFFGATLVGKAIIKSLLQSSLVILAFHGHNLETLIKQIDFKLSDLFPRFQDLDFSNSFTIFLQEQRNNVIKRHLDEPKQSSSLSLIFNWIIFGCCILFIISLIGALDKQYQRRKSSSSQRRTD